MSVIRRIAPIHIFIVFLFVAPQVYSASHPTNLLHGPRGQDYLLTGGEYVQVEDGLDTYHNYYIEVPPNTPQLRVDIFDADVGDGPNQDRAETGGFETSATYTLRRPTGFTVATMTGDDNGPNNSDNAWINLYNVTDPLPGHWEFRVRMSGGDDVNEFGLRAHDGTSGAGGVELNIYAPTFYSMGVNETPRTFVQYPWITSGTVFDSNDFDFDRNGSNGSISFTSRSLNFSTTIPNANVSVNGGWRNNPITGWSTLTQCNDYGMWSNSIEMLGTSANYITFYVGRFNAANPPNDASGPPPSNNPEANTVRIYLPSDSGNAPVKPYMGHRVNYVSGPNPPVVGQTTRVRITVTFTNPTPFPVTFSTTGSRTIRGFIPGAGAVYAGGPTVTQGSITGQPGIGNTGTITWNPGVVAQNTSVTMTYDVNVTPQFAGQVAITGSPTSNGTVGVYTDETGNTSQSIATFTFGPLCQLFVTTSANVPTAAKIRSLDAMQKDGRVLLRWSTEFEVDNLGFHIYRESNGKKVRLTESLIAGSAFIAGAKTPLTAGHEYSWQDNTGTSDSKYWIEDLDLNGKSVLHGPIFPVDVHEFPVNSPAVSSESSKISAPMMQQPSQRMASSQTLKIKIKETGYYRMTQPELVAAGLDPAINPRLLKLTLNGKQIPIYISGEADGSFDPADFVEFYGTAITSPWTDLQAFFLSKGQKPGKRISQSIFSDVSLPSAASFVHTQVVKPRSVYFAALLNGDEENFFGPITNTTPTDLAIYLNNVDAGETQDAILQVAVLGVTSLTDQDPDHLVSVRLNGVDVGQFTFDGQSSAIQSFQIPHSWLLEGSNVISISTGGDVDYILPDFARISYNRNLVAFNGKLQLSVPGSTNVRVDGFPSNDARVVDVTDSASPVFVQSSVEQTENGFAVAFSAAEGPTRSFVAFEGPAALKPFSTEAIQPSAWRNYAGARIVMIAPAAWTSSLVPLRDLRNSQGKSAVIVPLEDIYDEFNYGMKSPEAIRNFLSRAKRWNHKAKFVLLAGDATFDPKDYLSFHGDIVPTKLVDTSALETASDDWFTDFDGDGIANLSTGRLPARNQQELDLIVSKILLSEQSGNEDWRSEALLVADGNGSFDFETAAAEIENQMNGIITSSKILRGQMETDEARALVLSEISRGHVLVNYIGHGSVQGWSAQQLLTSSDAAQLTNAGRLPFFVNMTCYNGFFQDLFTYSLSEALLTSPAGGAVAVWASSGITPPPDQHLLNREVIRLLFGKKQLTIGEAVKKAKKAIDNPDIRKTWILFGDPSMRMRYETPEPVPEGD